MVRQIHSSTPNILKLPNVNSKDVASGTAAVIAQLNFGMMFNYHKLIELF